MPIALKRSGSTVLVRNDSRYKRSKGKFSLTPQTKTWRNSSKTEVKQIDSVITNNTPVSNGNVFTFGLVDQGTDNNQRIGKAISLLSGEARIRLTGLSGADFTNWRIIIGVWKQAYGGSVPLPSDIVQVPGSLNAHINAEDSTNLVILADETYNMSPNFGTAAAGGPPTQRYHTIKWRYRGTQEYKGISFIDVQNIELFCYMITDNTTAVRSEVMTRVYFTDN